MSGTTQPDYLRVMLAELLQDETWRGEPLEDLDRHHRANLIPFLRRNVETLYEATHGRRTTHDEAETWLAETPLMRRLIDLELGLALEQRRETMIRNKQYEAATGYRKIALQRLSTCRTASHQVFGPHACRSDCVDWKLIITGVDPPSPTEQVALDDPDVIDVEGWEEP